MRDRKDPFRFRTAHALVSLALLAAPAAPGLAVFAQAGASASGDSTAALRDPFLAPPPAPVADSSHLPGVPSRGAVKLTTQGTFTNPSPRVGDSLDYVVRVEWEDTGVPVFVLAPDSLEFPGFKLLGQATVHKKVASGSTVRNRTEFIYRLRARTQGTGKAASLKVRYLTGLSRQEEAIFIPTALADIGPAPVRLLDMVWFKILLWALMAAAAGAAGYAAYRLSLRKRAAKAVAREDLKPEVAALKARLRTALNSPDASKTLLLEMEGLAIRYLRDETASAAGGSRPSASPAPARFDPLLDAYLARTASGTGANGHGHGGNADWDKLRDLFRHARFAGGYKEPHELQDAFRTFRICLKMTGDDDHE